MISAATNDAAILGQTVPGPAKAPAKNVDRLLSDTYEEIAAAKQLLKEDKTRAKRAKRKLARDNAKRAAELVKKTIKSIEHHEGLLVEAKKRDEGKPNRRHASKKNRAIKKGKRAGRRRKSSSNVKFSS